MIKIDEHELTSDHTTKQCKSSMVHVEAKIGNVNQPLFGDTDPDVLYYSAFGDTDNSNDNLSPYGE